MDYKKGYLTLFNGATDALALMEQQNFGMARQTLMQAQSAAEENVISQPDEKEDSR